MSPPSVRDYAPRRYRCHPPERRQGAIQRERALRFEWMGWLRAFIAGVVLALGLARVSPSGKARASQARMRGFESRHPLQKKFKAGLQFRTAPHRWRFIRRPAFLMGASRFCQLTWDIGKSTSSLVCISLSQDLPHCPRWGFVALAESYALFFAGFTLVWQSNHHKIKNLGFFATFLRLRMSLFQDHTWLFLSVTRKLFKGRGARNNGYSRKRLFFP